MGALGISGAQLETGAVGTAHFEPDGVVFQITGAAGAAAEDFSRAASEGFPMTIKNTAFYTLSFGMLVLLGVLLWTTGPDLVIGLFADLR